jgi:aminoglycoside phosphotransferase family enzyme
MESFDEDTLFDRLARKGGLDRAMMGDLADAIADFYHMAESRTDAGDYGIAMIIHSNAECFAGIEWFSVNSSGSRQETLKAVLGLIGLETDVA